MEKLVRYSTFDFQMEKLVRYLTFDIRYSNGEVSSIFDIPMEIRYSIFEPPLLVILLGSKTFFGILEVTEYQVFDIKTNF